MYALFAILVAASVFLVLLAGNRTARGRRVSALRLAGTSSVLLAVSLFAFSLASRVVGIDVGPFHPVSYNIPDDFVNKGVLGLLALAPLAVASLSPVLGYTLARPRA